LLAIKFIEWTYIYALDALPLIFLRLSGGWIKNDEIVNDVMNFAKNW